MKKVVVGILAMAAAIGPLILIGGSLIRNVREISRVFQLLKANPVVLAISLIIVAIGLLIANWEKVKAVVKRAWDSMPGWVKTGAKLIVGALGLIVKAIDGIINAIETMIGWIQKAIEWLDRLAPRTGAGGAGGFIGVGPGPIGLEPRSTGAPRLSLATIAGTGRGVTFNGPMEVFVEANDADEFADSMQNIGRSALNRRGL
jgi:hypothetical protein